MLTNAIRSLHRSSLSISTTRLTSSSCRLFSTRFESLFRSSVSSKSALLPPLSSSPSSLTPPRVNMSSTAAQGSGGAAAVYDTYAKADQTGSKPSSTVSGKNSLPSFLDRPVNATHTCTSSTLLRSDPRTLTLIIGLCSLSQDATNSVFFVCDIQETFRDKMVNWPLLVASSTFLTRIATQLNIPVIVTEQKPFKPTIAELSLDSNAHTLFNKTLFSMLTPAVRDSLTGQHSARRHVFLYGIEAHVCVMQTTLDLLREGYIVHLPLDAVTSMYEVDREAAIERYRGLAQQGVVLTSAESVMFELVADASKPEFKKMVPLVKEYAAAKKKHAQVEKSGTEGAATSKL